MECLAPSKGASSTVYDRFRLWEAQGFFQRLWQAELQQYDELVGIAWDWQSVDSSSVKAPFAQPLSDPLPLIAANKEPNGASCAIVEDCLWL